MTVGTDVSYLIAGLIQDLQARENEVLALKDAMLALKQFLDGEREDTKNIAEIINGALRLTHEKI